MPNGQDIQALQREDWDFSRLPKNEYLAALHWEVRRECPDAAEVVLAGKAWLEGELSDRRPPYPMRKGKRRPKFNPRLSDAEGVRLRTQCLFAEFVPTSEFSFHHKWSLKQNRIEYNHWLANCLRPLVKNYNVPWLGLLREERIRLRSIMEGSADANVVHIPSWWEAISHYKREKIDAGLPLIFSHSFSFSEMTTLLLRIEWRYTKKRILTAIKKIIDEYEPQGIPRWSRRGRKHRDWLVVLERLGMMRLLHHYTLAEVRLRVPDAWKLYETRKWYDERRRALKDFRAWSPYAEAEKFFPVSWETKAQRSRKASELPAK